MAEVVKLARPKPDAKAVVFYSFAEGSEGGEFYDSLVLKNTCHPMALLVDEMNHAPLGSLYGAPLRLRFENQLGFKMVKWIRRTEFVTSTQQVGEGEGGITRTMSILVNWQTFNPGHEVTILSLRVVERKYI